MKTKKIIRFFRKDFDIQTLSFLEPKDEDDFNKKLKEAKLTSESYEKFKNIGFEVVEVIGYKTIIQEDLDGNIISKKKYYNFKEDETKN